MTKTIVAFVFGLLATVGLAEPWDFYLRENLYGAKFDEYAVGESLSNKGASGGAWGNPTIPDDVSTMAKVADGRHYMNCSTMDDGLLFLPEGVGFLGHRVILLSTRISGFDELPEPRDSDKAAFIIHDPDGGVTSFMGLSAKGWEPLHLESGKVRAVADAWYDLAIRIVAGGDKKLRVQYRLKVDGDYEPLMNAAGNVWMDAPLPDADAVVHEIEFRGEGDIGLLEGTETNNGLAVGVRQD